MQEEEKREQRKRLLMGVMVGVGFVMLLCIVGISAAAVGAFVLREQIAEAVTRPPRVQPYDDLPTALPDDRMPPNGDLDAQFAAIEEVIVDVRGLPLEYSVPRDFLTGEELAEEVEQDFFAEYTEELAADDAIVYAALDVLPVGFDLFNFFVELYSEGVAGFYDPEEEAFYILSDDDLLDPEEEITYAHELVHVLQDQTFNLDEFMRYGDDTWYLENADAAAARIAVIEGDATLTERLYEQNYMLTERRDAYYETIGELDITFFQGVPAFILRDFVFPYAEGFEFVNAIYQQGGFAAVDALYTDPPTSTEQVLHPEKYLNRDEPQAVSLPDALPILGEDYRFVLESQLGEFGLRNYVQQELALRGMQAADGWDGDRYAVYFDDGAQALVFLYKTVWDSSDEADEFRRLYANYTAALGLEETVATELLTCWSQSTGLRCTFLINDDETLLLRAPDRDTIDRLLTLFR